MDARFLELCGREFAREVERAFEGLPLDACELPVIGDAWPFAYHDRAAQKQVVIAALVAKEWFTHEGPEWAQPLLLKADECRALFNNHYCGPNRRALLRGRYGMHARERSWDLKRLTPFEVFCAYELSPPA